jgi:hypothetical protein
MTHKYKIQNLKLIRNRVLRMYGKYHRRTNALRSRDSIVGIATGYGLHDRGVGVRVPVGARIFSSPYLPDRLWGPPCLLSNGYRGLIPGGRAAGT